MGKAGPVSGTVRPKGKAHSECEVGPKLNATVSFHFTLIIVGSLWKALHGPLLTYLRMVTLQAIRRKS